MAHESFEDAATAALMNERLRQRQGRPRGTPRRRRRLHGLRHGADRSGRLADDRASLTPDGEAVLRRHVLPADARATAMPSFAQVLAAISDTWRERRDEVRRPRRASTRALAERSAGVGRRAPAAGRRAARDAVRRSRGDVRPGHGGFGGAPKFPPSMVLEWLLRHHARTGDADGARDGRRARSRRWPAAASTTSSAAASPATASTPRWVVPHFEKMLYDNALLLRVYAHLWRATGFAARRTRRRRDGRVPAARPAYGRRRVRLGPRRRHRRRRGSDLRLDARRSSSRCSAPRTARGRPRLFDGHRGGNLRARRVDAPAAPRPGRPDTTRWQRVRAALAGGARARARSRRRDDKVVAAWNGLAIAALAEAGALLDRPDWVEAAVACGDLLLAVHLGAGEHGDRLVRVSRDGVAGRHAGVLEDYGDVAEGLLALYAVTGDGEWLACGRRPARRRARATSRDGRGGFYDTADDAEALRAAAAGPHRQRHAVRAVGRGRRPAHLRGADRVRRATARPRRRPSAVYADARPRAPAVRRLGAGRRRGPASTARARSLSSAPRATRRRPRCAGSALRCDRPGLRRRRRRPRRRRRRSPLLARPTARRRRAGGVRLPGLRLPTLPSPTRRTLVRLLGREESIVKEPAVDVAGRRGRRTRRVRLVGPGAGVRRRGGAAARACRCTWSGPGR